MRRSGTADLPLHNGSVPKWLYERMARIGLAITETIVAEYGSAAFLSRLSNPFWFQCFGAVMGMDWHSSGITTSVMGALKRSVNPHSASLGLYFCGGKGKFSKEAPAELMLVGDKTGLDGNLLVRCSKLSAKVDNTAVQDGFQLYQHHFVVNSRGDWSVIQQGMRDGDALARRYHWHSGSVKSFVETPHTGICGQNLGTILNLTAHEASTARQGIMHITQENPEKMMQEINRLVLPSHHDVRAEDVDTKRLGAALWLAHEIQPQAFEDLLLIKGLGPRTIQSLTLVSEVIHGTPSRFKDPARFSFAHGGKDGHPFPVPLQTYDETIATLEKAVRLSKIAGSEKDQALKKLHQLTVLAEKDFIPTNNLDAVIEKERADSWKYGGKTVFGDAQPPRRSKGVQLRMF